MKSTFEFLGTSSATSGAGAVAPGQRIDSGGNEVAGESAYVGGG